MTSPKGYRNRSLALEAAYHEAAARAASGRHGLAAQAVVVVLPTGRFALEGTTAAGVAGARPIARVLVTADDVTRSTPRGRAGPIGESRGRNPHPS